MLLLPPVPNPNPDKPGYVCASVGLSRAEREDKGEVGLDFVRISHLDHSLYHQFQ
jgi:hypothetical protein